MAEPSASFPVPISEPCSAPTTLDYATPGDKFTNFPALGGAFATVIALILAGISLLSYQLILLAVLSFPIAISAILLGRDGHHLARERNGKAHALPDSRSSVEAPRC